MIAQSRLKELLHYDPDTGDFTWLVQAGRIRIGDIAGSQHSRGYRDIRVDGKSYYAHRLAWLWMTGAWPVAGMDHRNGVRDDNRWGNLREATSAENQQNRATNNNNKCGFTGVCWCRQRRKWRAYINISGRNKYLGLFTTPEAAHEAYLAAKAAHHAFQPATRGS